ncbi:hypothetical protein AS593_17755 [Caulobacter vibrioides]|nr:hypothetical protein AS593_17755 [Caulobacter vibrioides]
MRTDGRRTRRLAGSETAACAGLTALVFGAVLAFGASDTAVAAVFAGLYALSLVILLSACGWARRDLARLGGWTVPAVLAGLLLAAVLAPLTPWTPDGPHPVWRFLPDGLAASTLDRSAVLLNVLNLLGLFCLYVAARVVAASQTRGRRLLAFMLWGLGIYAAGALVHHVGLRGEGRLSATLLGPNSAATVFAAGVVMAAAGLAQRLRRTGSAVLKKGDPRAVALAGLAALLVVCLLMTASRGGLIAGLVGAGMFTLWQVFAGRRMTRTGAVVLGGAAVLLAAVLGLNGAGLVIERFDLAQQDLDIRRQIIAPHWRAFLSAPWFGYGLGSFPSVNQMLMTEATLRELHNVRAVHNLYVQWLEEAGIVGAALMAALFGERMAPVVRAAFGPGGVGIWARGAVCAAAVFLIHGLSDFALQVPAIQALAVLGLGAIGGLVSPRRETRGAKPDTAPARLALAGGGACALVALSMAAPMLAAKVGGDLADWPTAPADALAAGIERGLARRDLSPRVLARLDKLSRRELASRPGSGSAWLRRAAIDAAAGQDGPSALALERSFTVAPLQTSLFSARTMFAYERWDRLTPTARTQTIYQLSAEWRRADWKRKEFVRMANAIHNPAGRVGLALQLTALRLQQP